ncbi:hypothetical protein [Bifidobacterium adolescentis]|nr:hypothetical protein [Bifidobacterium adolescentis]
MVVVIVAAVVAACLLMVWSLCRAAALGDEIAGNLRAKRSDGTCIPEE